ncbi:hypothetical protein THMIRHAM_22170 [Thiomicrorhabdus immobilis]|uniref:Uncharacterized protein n=1 Tax=Thiomicrorhabdus immobilis TaxID=2791037 RepID=A0ABN6CZA9_9GAMM|nr:hypothetical protein [Thiomicrorhabdus immobilis]BCN94432.1 hypothetical protein THMIRHAM_22170 [Thiomicrorhabdus immobilis]
MKHLEIKASLCELFKKAMAQAGWHITHQDVGQTELLAYGYVIIWEKESHKVVLHYSDRQGIAQANIETSPQVEQEIKTIISTL